MDTLLLTEVVQVCESLQRWLQKSNEGPIKYPGVGTELANTQTALSLITHVDFPHLAFVCTCWDLDSMMTRKRLWGQAKRFEVLWRDYRLNSWQAKDIFFPSIELWKR